MIGVEKLITVTLASTPNSYIPFPRPLDASPQFGFPYPGYSLLPWLITFVDPIHSETSFIAAPSYSYPKLPTFSGQEDPPKGEVFRLTF